MPPVAALNINILTPYGEFLTQMAVRRAQDGEARRAGRVARAQRMWTVKNNERNMLLYGYRGMCLARTRDGAMKATPLSAFVACKRV